MKYNHFFKVIVLKIEVFESMIIDERHFKDMTDVKAYVDKMKAAGYTTVIAAL